MTYPSKLNVPSTSAIVTNIGGSFAANTTISTSNFTFNSNGSPIMTINSSGHVGIGNPQPNTRINIFDPSFRDVLAEFTKILISICRDDSSLADTVWENLFPPIEGIYYKANSEAEIIQYTKNMYDVLDKIRIPKGIEIRMGSLLDLCIAKSFCFTWQSEIFPPVFESIPTQ